VTIFWFSFHANLSAIPDGISDVSGVRPTVASSLLIWSFRTCTIGCLCKHLEWVHSEQDYWSETLVRNLFFCEDILVLRLREFCILEASIFLILSRGIVEDPAFEAYTWFKSFIIEWVWHLFWGNILTWAFFSKSKSIDALLSSYFSYSNVYPFQLRWLIS